MTRSIDEHAVRLLVCLYAAEAFVLLMLIGIYKSPGLDPALLPTRAGNTLIGGACGLLSLHGSWCARSGRWARGVEKALTLAFGTNVLTGLAIFALLEVAVRLVPQKTSAGIVINNMLVEPS